MPNLSIITHFYNQPQCVLDQIAYWEALPDSILSQVEFILIDDCSEQMPTFGPTRLDLKIFRVTTAIPWNQSGARNLGTLHARAEWALFFDLDQRFFVEPLALVIMNLATMNPMTLYHLRSRKAHFGSAGWSTDPIATSDFCFHINTFLVNLTNFKIHGMYDEDFAGHYGYEDCYMLAAWKHRGGMRNLYNDREYFDELGFGTATLNRDLTRNMSLGQAKLLAGFKSSPGLLRFRWEQLRLDARVQET